MSRQAVGNIISNGGKFSGGRREKERVGRRGKAGEEDRSNRAGQRRSGRLVGPFSFNPFVSIHTHF